MVGRWKTNVSKKKQLKMPARESVHHHQGKTLEAFHGRRWTSMMTTSEMGMQRIEGKLRVSNA